MWRTSSSPTTVSNSGLRPTARFATGRAVSASIWSRSSADERREAQAAISACSGEVDAGSPTRTCANQRIESVFRFHRNGTRSRRQRRPAARRACARVGRRDRKLFRVAHRAPRRSLPHELMLWRLERAERVGLTYEEYTLEIIERGRYLGPDDAARV